MVGTRPQGLEKPQEEDSFLEWRGIGMCPGAPELFKEQLRMILRAALYGRLRIVLPASTDGIEFRAAEEMLEECRGALESEGTEYGEVEIRTPATALRPRNIATKVALTSVGANNLAQYTQAAGRGNKWFTRLRSADHPAGVGLRGGCEEAEAGG